VTSAACECAHSKVDLVQSAVRASMCSDRLENLVVTSSEKQTVDELSADAVIDDLSTCTKIPTAGAYSAPPGSLAGIKRRYFSRGGKQTGEERKEGEVPKNLDPPVTKTQLCPCMESEKIMTPVMGPIAPMNMVGMIMIKYTSEIEFEEVISPNNMVNFVLLLYQIHITSATFRPVYQLLANTISGLQQVTTIRTKNDQDLQMILKTLLSLMNNVFCLTVSMYYTTIIGYARSTPVGLCQSELDAEKTDVQ